MNAVIVLPAEAHCHGEVAVWPPKYFSKTIFPSFSRIKALVLLSSKKVYRLSIFGWQYPSEAGARVSQALPTVGGKYRFWDFPPKKQPKNKIRIHGFILLF
jgi:hypothetical protein